MHITDLTYKVFELEPKVSFNIAQKSKKQSCTIIVKLETDIGLVGFGEANPSPRVTGESVSTVQNFLLSLKEEIVGVSPFEIEKIHKIMNFVSSYNSSAKAAVDIACYDLCAKKSAVPLYTYLGGNSDVIESDMSIGIDEPEVMAKRAAEYVKMGFNILKIKVGMDVESDIEAVHLIREKVGPDVELRLDANQGWDFKTSIYALKMMQDCQVIEIEQPVPKENIADLKHLRLTVPQLVMADEAIMTPVDAVELVKAEACDMFNIKLMKSAGIYPALQINAIAEAAGIKCMVGCMAETTLGIAAGAALAAAKSNIPYADLDSHHLNHEINAIKCNFKQEGGKIFLSKEPGLGIFVEI